MTSAEERAPTWLSGVVAVYGVQAVRYFLDAHVVIVGMGGVGSWAVEGLVRSGIGRLTLIDMDDIEPSNTNRQLHALQMTYGKSKVLVMKERMQHINPQCRIVAIEDFVTPNDPDRHWQGAVDFLLDAIDVSVTKVALLQRTLEREVAVLTVGAAGARRDPFAIQKTSLDRVTDDRLLAKVRHGLRRSNPIYPSKVIALSARISPSLRASSDPLPVARRGKLDCQRGYGSLVTVTATFGFFAAAVVLEALAEKIRGNA